MDPQQTHFLLGEISGKLTQIQQQQATQTAALEKLDERLRQQETKSAALGALSGGVVSIGVALVIESLKDWVKNPRS